MGEGEGLPTFKKCRFERLFEYDFSSPKRAAWGIVVSRGFWQPFFL
ncbi:hypothetical protein [Pseudobacillus wudalianchiensis]|nr:hypothetical protein [Bacillus wudalianchiensis]